MTALKLTSGSAPIQHEAIYDPRRTYHFRLYAKLEDISVRGRNEFIGAVLQCDDYELTISLLYTIRLSSAHTVALLAMCSCNAGQPPIA